MSKHPAYGQSLLKLGLHLSDPVVELGTVWARGDHASARLIHQAILSAEHLRQGRDKMLARVAGSIINKLKTYHSEAVRDESRRHKSPYAAHSLTGRRNPGKRKHDARKVTRAQLIAQIRDAATGSMEFHDDVDDLDTMTVAELRALFNSYVRNNPRGRGRHRTGKSAGANADRYLARHSKATRARKGRRTLTKRARQSASRRHMRMLTKGVNPYQEDRYYADREIKRVKSRKKGRATKRGMRAVLGRMNPRPNENDIPTVIIKRIKRNPAISSKDATAMCRILRNHGYTCTKKGAKRRSKARSKSRK